MTVVSAETKPKLRNASSPAFARFGTLIPAGPVTEHLMDARIFRSIQNRVTHAQFIELRDPEVECCDAARWTGTINDPRMAIHGWERTILTPDGTFDAILAVAARHDYGRNDILLFRIPPNCAVNILAGIAFGSLMSTNLSRTYWRIGDLAGLVDLRN